MLLYPEMLVQTVEIYDILLANAVLRPEIYDMCCISFSQFFIVVVALKNPQQDAYIQKTGS